MGAASIRAPFQPLLFHMASRGRVLLLSLAAQVGGVRACVRQACTGRRPAGWRSGPGATRRRAGAGVRESFRGLTRSARNRARTGQEPGHRERGSVRADRVLSGKSAAPPQGAATGVRGALVILHIPADGALPACPPPTAVSDPPARPLACAGHRERRRRPPEPSRAAVSPPSWGSCPPWDERSGRAACATPRPRSEDRKSV